MWKALVRHGFTLKSLRLPLIAVFAALVGLGLDQWIKYWVQQRPVATTTLIPGMIDSTLVYNSGAAFGMLSQWSWSSPVLGVLSVLMSLFLVYCLWYVQRERLKLVAITCILSGALGNLYDRITLGYVVDYLHLHLGSFSLFVFNFADFAITLGAGLWIYAELLQKRSES